MVSYEQDSFTNWMSRRFLITSWAVFLHKIILGSSVTVSPYSGENGRATRPQWECRPRLTEYKKPLNPMIQRFFCWLALPLFTGSVGEQISSSSTVGRGLRERYMQTHQITRKLRGIAAELAMGTMTRAEVATEVNDLVEEMERDENEAMEDVFTLQMMNC
jgi:hypothetical protein